METKPIRVVLVEDHLIVRQGLRALLETQEGIEVAGETGDGGEAVALCLNARPDVAVIDLGLPGRDGVRLTEELQRRLPRCRALILSMHAGEEYVRAAVRAGAAGYLVKGAGLADLVRAIRAVAAGEAFFCGAAAAVLAREVGGDPAPSGGRAALTEREREVLRLVALGKSSREIGIILGISRKTVEGHRANIMEKLDIHDLASLVRHAVKAGLVPPEP